MHPCGVGDDALRRGILNFGQDMAAQGVGMPLSMIQTDVDFPPRILSRTVATPSEGVPDDAVRVEV